MLNNEVRVNHTILERFGEPSKIDSAPYGAICKVQSDHKTSLYMQISKDELDPEWHMVTTLSESVSQAQIQLEIDKIKDAFKSNH
jgi:hypothetical protein